MRSIELTSEEVLKGYDAVCSLYAHTPPLSHWRAWEYAAYQKYRLNGRVLDLGCGDGRYFRLLWPDATDVVGVDMNPIVAAQGLESGIYRKAHVVPAHKVPEASESFDHVFANCSLEHMDSLDEVLAEVFRYLKPGGSLLCSVVTDRFLEWAPLPKLVNLAGYDTAAAKLESDMIAYHHLVNPLSVKEWESRFLMARLVPEEHIPIVPKINSNMFLLIDALWHIERKSGGELGDLAFQTFSQNQNFPLAFRTIFQGLMEMETNWDDCSGAVFLLRKPI